MSSQLKSDTARANGAKSHGPVTPQGRATSSRNSLRHGFAAKSVVLPTESSPEFQALLDSYLVQFDPQGGVEEELVQTMVAARWRLRRICNIETILLANEMLRRAEDIDEEFTDVHDIDRLAWVFQRLADHGQSLALVVRYEGALNRSYDRAFKQLQTLQSARHRVQPNEPKPEAHLAPVTPRLVNPIPAPDAGGRTRACPPLLASDPAPDPAPTSSSSESSSKPIPPTDGDLDP